MATFHLIVNTTKDEGRADTDELQEALEEAIEALQVEAGDEGLFSVEVLGIGTTRKGLDESKRLRAENAKLAGAQ